MRWPPYQHVFFDCDSTLTSVEGINVLAESAGKGWRVKVLTEAAMNGEIELEGIYDKRLKTLNATRGQVRAIREAYKANIVPDSTSVIETLQALGHKIYIVSGGLAEPVIEFGLHLSIPRQNIYAVNLEYDQLSGQWWQSDDHQPNVDVRYLAYTQETLTLSKGKIDIIREVLAGTSGKSLLIGDGISDLMASTAVDLFVGFGGVTTRSQVRNNSPLFIRSESMAPLLSIAAGPASLKLLGGTPYQEVSERSLQMVADGAITFRDEQLKEKFELAISRTH
jgi:phosphoserine phosphatase